MYALLEFVVLSIRRFIYRIRIQWLAYRNGYRISNFEWLPDNDDRIVRIIPLGDGFEHVGDFCDCNPTKMTESSVDGEDYLIIKHREMNTRVV